MVRLQLGHPHTNSHPKPQHLTPALGLAPTLARALTLALTLALALALTLT